MANIVKCPLCETENDAAASQCSSCGSGLNSGNPSPAPQVVAPTPASVAPASAPAGSETCPDCGRARVGIICSGCGYNFKTKVSRRGAVQATEEDDGSPKVDPESDGKQPATPLIAIVTCDRALYDRMYALALDGVEEDKKPALIAQLPEFPDGEPPVEVNLVNSQISIGRTSSKEPSYIPRIRAGHDTFVSRHHAQLLLQNGGYVLVDKGSTGGTLLNGVEVKGSGAHPIKAGDVIEIGFFTRIEIAAA